MCLPQPLASKSSHHSLHYIPKVYTNTNTNTKSSAMPISGNLSQSSASRLSLPPSNNPKFSNNQTSLNGVLPWTQSPTKFQWDATSPNLPQQLLAQFRRMLTTQNPEQGHEESKKESKLCEGKIRVEKHEKEAQQRDSWWVLSARGRKDEPRKAETISRERNFQECLIGVISFLGTPCSCVAISPWSSLESWAT